MIVTYAVATHLGLVRSENQDAVVIDGWVGQSPRLERSGCALVRGADTWTCAVLDGMGGYAGGATAAVLAAHALATSLRARVPGDPESTWAAAYAQASERVCALAELVPPLAQMGATVASVLVHSGGIAVTNVGDVRVYRQRRGYLSLLSEDDRTPTGAVTQALGAHLRGTAVTHAIDVAVTDAGRVLVCSDGLWDVAAPDRVAHITASESDVRLVARGLVAEALAAGGGDNISVIVADLAPESNEPQSPGAQS